MDPHTLFQREVTHECLRVAGRYGFALAGGGALREHGITSRKTEDVDLFTLYSLKDTFHSAVTAITDHLTQRGYTVTMHRLLDTFAAFQVTRGNHSTSVDCGIDYRSQPPAQLAIGPVISLTDAIGSKVAALFSRNMPRDYYDVYAIRQSGRFTDDELLHLAHDFDGGFSLPYFIKALINMPPYDSNSANVYGISEYRHNAIRSAMTTWGKELEERTIGGTLVPKEIRSLLDDMNSAPANAPLPEETSDDRTQPTTTYTSHPDHEL